ncbi:MAG: ResA-like WAxxUGC motif-containing protein, partial [Acidimicrobiales bacterium]
GLTVVTVALDIDPEKARPWIEAASPTHPSLIDSAHVTNELFGFHNVPMAVWIDETGTLVRPAESASIDERDIDSPLPDELPDRVKELIGEARKIPDIGAAYRAAVVDWANDGSDSAYALDPAEVVAASHPRERHHAEAAANFELGQHLFTTVGKDAAIPFWRAAHELDPTNWTYKRQAWTLETTPEGEPSDLMQPPNDVYEGNWLDDVRASGGGENYITKPTFIS